MHVEGSRDGCMGVCACACIYLIKGTTCVVCCVCISPCSAVGDWEVSAEWVGAQGVAL